MKQRNGGPLANMVSFKLFLLLFSVLHESIYDMTFYIIDHLFSVPIVLALFDTYLSYALASIYF